MKTVQCFKCGYLSKRSRAQGPDGWRAHDGYHEADKAFRNNPKESFPFVPGSINAVTQGEIECYRDAADFSSELAAARLANDPPGVDPAHVVIYRHRHCTKFYPYQTGITPPDHLVEEKAAKVEDDRRRFELTLAEFQRRLASRDRRQNLIIGITAVLVTLVIGIIQLWTAALSMVPESLGYYTFARPFLEMIGRWFGKHL
jgi:hypothetical protein